MTGPGVPRSVDAADHPDRGPIDRSVSSAGWSTVEDMKSYLPATVMGIALTAAAFGFGAATNQSSLSIRDTASQVISHVPALGDSTQISAGTPTLLGWSVGSR